MACLFFFFSSPFSGAKKSEARKKKLLATPFFPPRKGNSFPGFCPLSLSSQLSNSTQRCSLLSSLLEAGAAAGAGPWREVRRGRSEHTFYGIRRRRSLARLLSRVHQFERKEGSSSSNLPHFLTLPAHSQHFQLKPRPHRRLQLRLPRSRRGAARRRGKR